MIARITGVLLESSLTEVVIDVHDIAYTLTVPLSTVDKLPALKQRVSLHTHLHVREDALQLFGFFSRGTQSVPRIAQCGAGHRSKAGFECTQFLVDSRFLRGNRLE